MKHANAPALEGLESLVKLPVRRSPRTRCARRHMIVVTLPEAGSAMTCPGTRQAANEHVHGAADAACCNAFGTETELFPSPQATTEKLSHRACGSRRLLAAVPERSRIGGEGTWSLQFPSHPFADSPGAPETKGTTPRIACGEYCNSSGTGA